MSFQIKTEIFRRMVCLFAVLLVFLGTVGCNGNGNINGDGPDPTVTKEEVISALNAGSRKVNSFFSWSGITFTNERYPNGQSGKATLVYKRPDKLYLLFSVGGQNIILMKTDGEYVDIYDFENNEGRMASVDNIRKFSDMFGGFRPDFLTKSMGLDIIEPSQTTMKIDGGKYVLTVKASDGNTRRLYISHNPFRLVRQDVFAGDADSNEPEISVEYFEHSEFNTEGTGETVSLPTNIIIKVPSKKLTLDLKHNPKDFKINDERAVSLQTDGTWRIRWKQDVPVVRLRDDGDWERIDTQE